MSTEKNWAQQTNHKTKITEKNATKTAFGLAREMHKLVSAEPDSMSWQMRRAHRETETENSHWF